MSGRPAGRRLMLTLTPEELANQFTHRGNSRSITSERKAAATQRAVHRALTKNATREALAVAQQQIREAAAQGYGPHGRSPKARVK